MNEFDAVEVKKILWFLNVKRVSQEEVLREASFFASEQKSMKNISPQKNCSLSALRNFLFINRLSYDYNEYYRKKNKHHSVVTKFELEELIGFSLPFDFPLALKFMGNIHVLSQSKTLGIVGSRAPEHSLLSMFRNKINETATKFTLISGGAIGVDAIAHNTFYDAGASCALVLGNGLNQLYPAENAEFFEKLVLSNRGVLLSQFDDDEPPRKHQFPMRNHLIAALASQLIIIQAARRSGTMVTARCALEYGKDVSVFYPGEDYLMTQNFAGNRDLMNTGCSVF